MTPKLGNWIIVLGVIGMFAGLCVLPAAMGQNRTSDLLPVGACLFSMGALCIAGGMYLKARLIQVANEANPATPAPANRKLRGGCELCGLEPPVVLCKAHQLHLCGNCLATHYDVRSCIYAPSARKPLTKTVKASAKARGA